jgi:hypothetical protein
MLKIHLRSLPDELVDNLQKEFQKIHEQYFLEKWEPSQLDGGRFAEAVLRIIEYKDRRAFTRIGKQINRKKIVSSANKNTKLPESMRLQMTTLAELLLDFRNKRNVGHLGLIEVNEMDATFVLNASNWIVAELIRLETKMSPNEAQKEITKIIERKVPIVEEIGGRLKCLNPKLNIHEEILVLCYQRYPTKIDENDLFNWIKYSNKTYFKKYLERLDKEDLVDYCDGIVTLTKRGLIWVEKNIKFELEL